MTQEDFFLSDDILEALAEPPQHVVQTDSGVLLPWQGRRAYARLMIPAIGPAEVHGAIAILREFAELLRAAKKYRVSNVPLRAGLAGSVLAPGVTRAELDGFVAFLGRQRGPLWVEFDVGETGKGMLCHEHDGKVRFYEVTANHASEQYLGIIGLMPYAVDLGLHDVRDDSSFSVEPFDPVGAYARLGAFEATQQTLTTADEIRAVMTRECTMAILIGACLAYPSTSIVRCSDDGRRSEARLGRDPQVNAIREHEGLRIW